MYLLLILFALIGLGCVGALGYFLLGVHDEDKFSDSCKFLGYEWAINIEKKKEFVFSIKTSAKLTD